MIRTILVPLDGSTFGEHALPWAVSLAKRAKATLHLVHVHKALEVTYAEMQIFDESLDKHIRDRERLYLEETVRKLADSGVKIIAVNKDGATAQAIRDHAIAESADLIVLTTHARGAFGRFWLGSVTDELLRDSPAPLLIVHPTDQPADPHADHVLEHLLLPLDGSPLSEQVLAPALAIGKLTGAEYTLYRVVKPVQPLMLPEVIAIGETASHLIGQIEQAQEQLKKEAAAYLESIAGRLRGEGHTVKTEIGFEDQPSMSILQRAQPPIDGIAIGTHGRKGLARLFLGSVADKVIRGAHVPVLVHRPGQG